MVARTLGVVESALVPSGEGAAHRSKKPSPTAAEQAARARTLFAQGDHKTAVGLAQTALAADPDSIDALAVLGELALLRRNNEQAAKMLQRAHDLAPNDVHLSAVLGEALLGQERWGEAESILHETLRLNPAEPRALLAMARLHEAQGSTLAAIEMLQQSRRLYPASKEISLRLGHALKKAGRLLEAVAAYRRTVGVDTPIAMVDPVAGPVRVAFIVQYPQGWTSLKSVWEAFAADPDFAVTVIACPNKPPHQVEGGSEAIYSFLDQQGVPYTRWNKHPLRPHFADLVFFQLPYDVTRAAPLSVPEIFKLVPRLAYVPYALEIGGGDENVNLLLNLPLHQFAWAVFARSARHKAAFARHCAGGDAHVVVTGHPKMDARPKASTPPDPDLARFAAGRKLVLWNPHYDVRPDGTAFGHGFSTILRWQQFLPEEFSRRQDLAFVIRPHPLFFDTLVQRRIMTRAQIDAFVARCDAAGNIQIDRRPSYLPVFAAATAIISDASSFILEFAATGKPVLYLHNPHGPGLNADGVFVRDYCATAETEAEIVRFLDETAAGLDPRGAARRAAYPEFMHLPPEGVGQAIKQAVLARFAAEAMAAEPIRTAV
jgi:tetratricopeptide (TPR) repeat protein